jgi:hypothetical protein
MGMARRIANCVFTTVCDWSTDSEHRGAATPEGEKGAQPSSR